MKVRYIQKNEYKLMQLIIFGQPEMTKLIRNYPNFEDRIAFNFELGPVSLEDTRGLIDYRIKISGEENRTSLKRVSVLWGHQRGNPVPAGARSPTFPP